MAKSGIKAKKDLFSRLRDALIDFFSEKPVKKQVEEVKKPKKPVKRKIRPRKPVTPKRRVTRKKPLRKKPKIRPEEVQMPAPWSKVTKYKKVKRDNFYF